MTRYLTEGVGTYFLVLTIGSTAIPGMPGVLPPLAVGAVLTALIYSGGPISGAHYNPAVTIAICMRGELETRDVIPYWVSQLVGASLAAMTVGYLRGAPEAVSAMAIGPALVAEFVFTFLLCWVILTAVFARGTSHALAAPAIGLTVMAGAFAVGDISGAAFNPAVALSFSLMGMSAWSTIWVFLVANVSAAVVAAVVFKLVGTKDA